MRVKVSVILPSLNVADYIRECIDSVLQQSLQELEIICIDAGSTDGTREILEEYANKDSRITILHSDMKSYGRQVNMGLKYASGDYIAILETDDWIAPDMYRCLYELAVKEHLDYAAADFDMFYQLQSGAYYFIRHHLFSPDVQDWYGKILGTEQLATLRSIDYVLWRGIYNREFLNTYHIRLHESPKAAFQDMGFLQQVKTYATRAIYLDQSFYRYRQDREEASSRGLDGLQYYQEEFRWLNEDLKLVRLLEGAHKKYYYFTMSISFLTKYEQILTKLNGDWQDSRLSVPYQWFQRQVLDAINAGFLEESMYDKKLWEKLTLLLEDTELYAKSVMDRIQDEKCRAEELVKLIDGKDAIIFGCGVRGERLLLFCEQHKIRIRAFCDNNTTLHGQKKYGFLVISPADLKGEMILLSMKNGWEQVYNQLLGMGISPDKVIEKIPEGIL